MDVTFWGQESERAAGSDKTLEESQLIADYEKESLQKQLTYTPGEGGHLILPNKYRLMVPAEKTRLGASD